MKEMRMPAFCWGAKQHNLAADVLLGHDPSSSQSPSKRHHGDEVVSAGMADAFQGV